MSQSVSSPKKTIALLSGGKDSILAVLMAYKYGYEPAVIVNIVPALSDDESKGTVVDPSEVAEGHDIDSYMYQTVGFEAVEAIASCLAVPLRRACVKRGRARDQSLLYSEQPPEDDEVESLYALLKDVKTEFPEVEGLTSGAILSNYQRNRVEYICDRLGIESLAYLWMRQPHEILDMAHELHVLAILVKTASIGLLPRQLIGRTLEEARPTLERMTRLYQSHLAGEGGEYETTVLDCPLFRHERLAVQALEVVMQDDNDISPSGHGLLTVKKVAKSAEVEATDAEVLSELRSGHLCFPSDVQPLLRDYATVSQKASVVVATSEDAQETAHSAVTAPLFFTDRARAGIVTHSVRVAAAVEDGAYAAGKVRATIEDLLEKVQRWAKAEQATPFFYHIRLTNTNQAEMARAAYASKVSHVCPPGLLVSASKEAASDATPDEILVAVLAAPSATIQQRVLHAQSRSCWALGEQGPYAQARLVGLDNGDSLLFVSPTPGRVPATRSLASWGDLPPACQRTLAEQLVAVGAVVSEHQSFAAQFLFAMAHCQSYLDLFKHRYADVTQATIFVDHQVDVKLLPLLWAWCTGGSPKDYVKVCNGRVVVSSLLQGERVRVSVECHVPADEC